MKSHFLNLFSANTTLFSAENKKEVTPFMPLDLPSTKGSVPAKTTGCSSPGERGHPALADEAPLHPPGTQRVRSLLIKISCDQRLTKSFLK